jgi:hypothetical protein
VGKLYGRDTGFRNSRMKFRRYIALVLIVLLLFIITVLLINKLLIDLYELIENENIDDISLTIYYMDPFTFTVVPISIDGLMNYSYDDKIVIRGNDLEEHIDLLKQINSDYMKPVWKKSPYINVRVYYVLESKKNGKLFDVAMWGIDDKSMFVNGLEVKGNNIFFDVIKPFLTENQVDKMEKWLSGGLDNWGK